MTANIESKLNEQREEREQRESNQLDHQKEQHEWHLLRNSLQASIALNKVLVYDNNDCEEDSNQQKEEQTPSQRK